MVNVQEMQPLAQPAELFRAHLKDDSIYQKTVMIKGRRFKLASPQEFVKRYGFVIGTLLEGPDEREVEVIGMIKESGGLVVCSPGRRKKVLLENIQFPENLTNEGYQWNKSRVVTKRKREEEDNDSLQATERVSRFFRNQQECDVFFLIEGQRIGGRSADLCKGSIYFRALLGGGFKENITQKNQQAKEISLTDCTLEEFQMLLQYLSNGHILITEENLLILFNIADQFGVDTLKSQCQEKLPALLSPTLALSYFQVLFGKECFLNPYLYNYIYDHRWAIFKEDAETVAKLSKEQLFFLIVHSPPESKEDFFEAVLIWLNHAKERKMRFHYFLADIFPLFPQEVDKLEKYSKALSQKDHFFKHPKAFAAQVSQNLTLLCIYARALSYRHQYGKAAKIIEQLLMKDPRDSFTFICCAANLCDRKQLPQAKEKYEEILSLEPRNSVALIGYAETLVLLEQFPQAQEKYEEVLALDPKNVSALVGCAEIFFYLGQFDQAKNKFEEALTLEPKNPFIVRYYAETLRLLNQFERAKEKFKEALALEPKHLFALIGYAETLGELGQLEQAKEKYEEVLALVSDDPVALRGYATILLKLLQFPQAKEKFEEALTLAPKDPSILIGYATTLRHLGQLDQAIKRYEEGLTLDPTNQLAKVGYAATLRQLRQLPQT